MITKFVAERSDAATDRTPAPSHAPTPRFSRLRQIVAFVFFLSVTTWMTLAVCYADVHAPTPRIGIAVLTAVMSCLIFAMVRPSRWRVGLLALLFGGVLIWFLSLKPSNERDWGGDVAILPRAIVTGDRVTIQNIRNFDYRTEEDYSPGYYDATLDVNRLTSIDLIVSYWSTSIFAHTLLSFGFDDGRYVAISIETRKEKTEHFSSVQGFFRRYELIYVAADERDLIGGRTNGRRENVYLYRLRMPREKMQHVFLDYMTRLNALGKTPEFFNALTLNCTTAMWDHLRREPPVPPLSTSMLLSGYTDDYAYRIGLLDDRLPFDELKRRSHINAAAREADHSPDFSSRIRKNLIDPNK